MLPRTTAEFRKRPPLGVDSLRVAYNEGFGLDRCRYEPNTVHEAAYWAGKMNRDFGQPIVNEES